jgi:hypothetical protein
MRICQATAGRGDLALSDELRLPRMISSFIRGPTLEPTKTQLPATITQAEITSPDLGARRSCRR